MGCCICPKCKSNNVIPIMYGYPAPSVMDEAEMGKIKLGGCVVCFFGVQPERFCKDCEYEWCVENFLSKDIVKVRFRYWSNFGCFESEPVTEDQWAFEIFADGTIKYYSYPRASRRVLDRAKAQIAVSRVVSFYDDVIQFYRPWNEIERGRILDGCSYELTITYADNRKKKIHGDLGGGTVDKTIMDFLCGIPEMKEKIKRK